MEKLNSSKILVFGLPGSGKTTQIFEKPNSCTFEIKDYNYDHIIKIIKQKL
tara:strand:- start:78 stop:230 length:153 start_codon:yes stop_codon:yes gene_type:complete